MAAAMTNDPLSKASSFMIQACNLDNNYPDLSHLMGCDSFNELTISDSETSNYPSLQFKTPELAPLKMKLIPAELQERMKELQCSCQMGLFGDINRAWLSIDNEIYLWTYDNSNDIAYYDGLNEVILRAALAKPKPGIFQSHITHILCLATPVEVVLLGVSMSHASSSRPSGVESCSDLHILPEPLFTLPVASAIVTTLCTTHSGRIFYGAKDGQLYEIDYQGDYGWFGKRSIWKNHHSSNLSSYLIPKFVSSYISSEDPIVQICVDEERHCLYTRSLHSNIQLYYLGREGTKSSRVACTLHQSNLKRIFNIIKSYDVSKFAEIKDMCVIPVADSESVHLMATTQTGVRLYYTTKSLTDTPQPPTTPPNTLTLIHVRLPPAFLTYSASNFNLPSFEHMSHVHYSQGTSLMVSSVQAEERGDVLWTLSSDLLPLSNHISETYDATQLAGQVWAFEELCSDQSSRQMEANELSRHSSAEWLSDVPLPVTQLYSSNKKFAIVTSLGVCVAVKLSTLDRLHFLLNAHNVESEQVHAYFKSLQDQALVNCLSLMVSTSLPHQQVSGLALKAFHLYKGTSHKLPLHIEYQTSTPAHHHLPPHGGPSSYHKPPLSDTPWSSLDLSRTSCNHRVLFIFVSRLLRPVWFKPIVTSVVHKSSETTFLASRLKAEEVACVLQKVVSLRTLFKCNPSLFVSTPLSQLPPHAPSFSHLPSPIHPTANPQAFMTGVNASFKEEMDESVSLRHLEMLVDVSCQLLSLWRLLCDHQFHVVSSKLPAEKQQFLLGCLFSQLVLESHDVCKQLVTCLLELYIEDNALIDVISAKLEQHCPVFYSSLDQAFNKGNECITAAKAATNPAEKEKLLDLAIKHYKGICSFARPSSSDQHVLPPSIDLSSMCSKLASVSAYTGIVELVVVAAANRDPNNLALHFYLNSKCSEDGVGESHYRARLDCYKSILECLNHLLCISQSCRRQQTASLPFGGKISTMLPSIFPSAHKSELANEGSCKEEADVQLNQVIGAIVGCEDRLCQFVLFRWMVDNNLLDKMLELQSLHMEEFLELEAMDQQQGGHKDLLYQKLMMDLLARYYIKQGKFIDAAKVLDCLALKEGNHINLMERLNFMTRASLCLQSSASVSSQPGGGHLLHGVQDKVEVIMLQLEVLKELEKLMAAGCDCSNAINLLNSQLFDVSELYTLFATPYDLSKCKLSIIRCSGHLDAELVQSLWTEVLNKELCESEGLEGACRMERFVAFVVSLGMNHRDSDNYFPLRFLVKRLEQTSVLEGFCDLDVSCMSGALLRVVGDVMSLHDAYYALYREKDSFWKNQGRQFHLVEVDCQLMASFVQQHSQAANNGVLSSQKRRASGNLLASISTYLVDLHSELQRQESLVSCLKRAQASLERMQACRGN